MNNNWSSLLVSAIALTAMVGCGGSSSNGPAAGPAVQHYYVADTGNARMVRFDSFAAPTNFLAFTIPTATGVATPVTPFPTDIGFDSNSNIYVVDQANNLVGELNSDFASGWTQYPSAPAAQNTAGFFSKPTGIAVDSLNRIYVADTGNRRIVRMDDMTGTNWVSFPPPGTASSPFAGPYNVRVDSNYNIYVTDPSTNTVYEMSDMAGDNLKSLTSFTSSVPTFKNPKGLDIDFQNHIFVADSGNSRVLEFTNIQGGGEQEWDSAGTLSNLTGLTALGRDQILMADTGHNRIYRVLQITGSSPSSYGTAGAGVDQLLAPLSVRAH